MDLSRAVYSRDLKIGAMRALEAGSTTGEIARKYSKREAERMAQGILAKVDLQTRELPFHVQRGLPS